MKVAHAKFHTPLFVPGIGTIGDTLPSQSKSYPIDMQWKPDGLHIALTHNSRVFNVIVPSANVQVVSTIADGPKPQDGLKT